MRIVLAAVVLWCAWPLLAGATGGGGPALVYEVTIEDPAEQVAEIGLTVSGWPETQTGMRLVMEEGHTFTRLKEPLVEGPLRASAGTKSLRVNRLDPFTWQVETGGATELQVSYRVRLTHREIKEVGERDAYEFPYLDADHGMLTSWTLFAAPRDPLPVRARVVMNLPEGWRAVAPWPSDGPGAFLPEDGPSLLHDLIAVGFWHWHEVQVEEFTGTIAIAPGQDRLEQMVVEPIRQIIESELSLFGLPAEGKYLFLIGRPDIRGLAGSPKTRSMTLAVQPTAVSMGVGALAHLIAHEFFHTWSAARFAAPDELRWFNEGFTDYYAYLVSARIGLLSWEEFAGRLGEAMQQCARNPSCGKLSLADAGGEVFFRQGDAYDLVYGGGLLVAAWLDRAIRGQGEGQTLDDFMRAFVNDQRWEKGERAPGIADFVETLGEFVDIDTADLAGELVRQPFAFDPVEMFAGLGVEIERTVTQAKLSLRANLDGTTVRDMDPSGVAARLGILPGDRLIEVNGEPVTGPDEVHRAWRAAGAEDNHIRVELERAGKRITIDQPIPEELRFDVPADPWREHALTCSTGRTVPRQIPPDSCGRAPAVGSSLSGRRPRRSASRACNPSGPGIGS
ncbi:MAG: PDZ domain-containing protein [Planctomycetota bacterium]